MQGQPTLRKARNLRGGFLRPAADYSEQSMKADIPRWCSEKADKLPPSGTMNLSYISHMKARTAGFRPRSLVFFPSCVTN